MLCPATIFCFFDNGGDAFMSSPRKKSARIIGLGVFLIVGPILQITFMPKPEVQVPADASAVARGYLEGSKEGGKLGTIISIILGSVIVIGGVLSLVGTKSGGQDSSETADSSSGVPETTSLADRKISTLHVILILLGLFIAFVVLGPILFPL
jgi:hypothetical protein